MLALHKGRADNIDTHEGKSSWHRSMWMVATAPSLAVGSHTANSLSLQAKKTQTVVMPPADSDFATDSGKDLAPVHERSLASDL